MSTSLLYHVFGVYGYVYQRTEYVGGEVVFTVEPAASKVKCSVCESRRVIRRGGRERRFRGLPIGKRAVWIELKVPRLECKVCGAVRQAEVAFAPGQHSYTKRFSRYVVELAQHMTMQDVAEHLGVSWDLVKDLLKETLRKRFGRPRLKDLRLLASGSPRSSNRDRTGRASTAADRSRPTSLSCGILAGAGGARPNYGPTLSCGVALIGGAAIMRMGYCRFQPDPREAVMPQISLATYTLRVRQKYQAKGEEIWETLDAIGDDNPVDFVDFVEHFLDVPEGYEEDANRQRLLMLDDHETRGRTIFGFFRAGPWGAAADIMDHRTRELAHEMSRDEAPLVPFFFLLNVWPDSTRGILMLQRFGRGGIKTHLCDALKRSFSTWKQGYLLEFWKHVPGAVLQELTEGGMRRVEVISYDTPSDLADFDAALRDSTEEWDELQGEVRTVITAKRAHRFPLLTRFRDVLTGDRTFHEVREELDLADARIRITVDHHGRERTIDLADPTDISPLVDITEEIDLTDDGHPERDQLVDYAMEFLPELIEDVRGRYE